MSPWDIIGWALIAAASAAAAALLVAMARRRALRARRHRVSLNTLLKPGQVWRLGRRDHTVLFVTDDVVSTEVTTYTEVGPFQVTTTFSRARWDDVVRTTQAFILNPGE